MAEHDITTPGSGNEEPAASEADAWALIDALFDGRSNEDSRRQLHQMVTSNPQIARMYARAAHLWAVLPRNVRRAEDPVALLARLEADTPDPMSDTMILPALREVDMGVFDGDAYPADQFPASVSYAPATPSRPRRFWAVAITAASIAAAALVILVLRISTAAPVAITPASPKRPLHGPVIALAPKPVLPPPVVVTAAAGAVWDSAAPAAPGTTLSLGQAFELSSGGLELTTDRGAVVVIEAPARLRVLDRDRLELQTGSMTAHVPPPAIGFSVVSPGLLVVDRGTNFGVRAFDGNTASEVAVFDGSVDAAAADADDTRTTAKIRVTAGQAATHSVGSSSLPAPVDYAPNRYLRHITDLRLPIPLHGTGQGLATGAIDPAWHVVGVPNQPDWKPAPAYVADVTTDALASNTPSAQWISLAAHLSEASAGDYRLRTSLDFTGFDPVTASVTAWLVGDGQVVDIIVNGISTSDQNPPLGNRNPASPPRRWRLENVPWHAGANDVVVVILKRSASRGSVGPLALQLSWAATARPDVHR